MLLTLTWSDCAINYAHLKDKKDCIYSGKMDGDEDSSVLVTGCKNSDVQIQSKVIGDWIFTTKNGQALALVYNDYDYDHQDYEENPDFDLQFPVVAEGDGRL